jgi:hypothetical protein
MAFLRLAALSLFYIKQNAIYFIILSFFFRLTFFQKQCTAIQIPTNHMKTNCLTVSQQYVRWPCLLPAA